MRCPLCEAVNINKSFRKFHPFEKHLETHPKQDLAWALADLLDILRQKRKLDKKKKNLVYSNHDINEEQEK